MFGGVDLTLIIFTMTIKHNFISLCVSALCLIKVISLFLFTCMQIDIAFLFQFNHAMWRKNLCMVLLNYLNNMLCRIMSIELSCWCWCWCLVLMEKGLLRNQITSLNSQNFGFQFPHFKRIWKYRFLIRKDFLNPNLIEKNLFITFSFFPSNCGKGKTGKYVEHWKKK